MVIFKTISKAQSNMPATNKKAVLDKLNASINAATPEVVYWLQSFWGDQQNAVTYKELREASMDGYEAQIQQWQEDYAKFIDEKMKPIWESTMAVAAKGVIDHIGKNTTYVFDTSTVEVRDWIQKHGAEFVTNVGQETRNAIKTIVARGQAERWTAQHTAMVIRPVIGLTQPQAVANVNYREHVAATMAAAHPNMTAAAVDSAADEAALKYAARQHRYRALNIANTESAWAYNVGAHESVRQAQQQGLMGPTKKVWSTARDGRVCPICEAMDGKEVGFDDTFDFKGKTLFPGAHRTPPAHPGCRCAVMYEETQPPVFKPQDMQPIDEVKTWDGKPMPKDAPDPPVPTIPAAVSLPKDIHDMGKVNIGGTGDIHLLADDFDNSWLFKPAQAKYSGNDEAFRAYAQEAGYKVQGIVDPDTAVQVGTADVNGTFGAFQQQIDTEYGTHQYMDYLQDSLASGKNIPSDIGNIVPQLQREHVTDWLLGNFDAHGGNFIVREGGDIIGIDKEQAFKYMDDTASHKMSYSYHPNAKYGEKEPIYNAMFRSFADKKIDMNLQDSLPYIKRIEAIPDAKYRDIFRPYAESLKGKGKDAEQLLDAIVERKQQLRDTYRDFYSDLLTVRTGKKQVFVFADESPAVSNLPLAGKMQDPASLVKMNKKDLLQIAKTKNIAYYNNMNKQQLITSIADPAQAPQMSAQVKEQLENAKKARSKVGPAPRQPMDAKYTDSHIVQAKDFFTDISRIPDDRQGVCVRADKDMLEGMNFTARRANIGGDEYYEVYGKLTEKGADYCETKAGKMLQKSKMMMNAADDQGAIYYRSDNLSIMDSMDVNTESFQSKSGMFDLIPGNSKYRALQRFFRVRVPADSNAIQRVESVMKDAGIEFIQESPMAADETAMKMRRIVWSLRPDVSGFEISQASQSELLQLLKSDGVDMNRVGKMRTESVWKGYSTYVDDMLAAELKKAGLKYAWSGIPRAEDVAKVLKSGGLSATKNRCIMGNAGSGASMQPDFVRGGADSVFCRIGVKSSQKFHECFCGHGYRVKIDPSVMGRTDWYAYEDDNFGNTEESFMMSHRKKPKEFVQDMVKSYDEDNEIMFRNGIRADKFIGINCDDESKRQYLLKTLHNEGIDDVNGVPIEKFVTVEDTIGK